MLKFGHCSKQMTPERQKRPSRSARKHVRDLKEKVRKDIEVTEPQRDPWNETLEILRLQIPDFDDETAGYSSILFEFFNIRRKIKLGGPNQDLINDFHKKHLKIFKNNEIREKLIPSLTRIRQIVG